MTLADFNQTEQTTLPTYRFVASSVRGSSHCATGQPCQDSHLVTTLPDGTVLIAVADGAGSALFGAVGATIATNIAVRQLEQTCPGSDTLDSEVWHASLSNAATRARDAIVAAAQTSGHPVAQFSTTLILCVVADGFIAAWQIGDGAVVADLEDEGIASVTTPLKGEHPNETVFLTAAGYEDHVQYATRRKIVRAAALFTDGLQRLGMNMANGSPHSPFFRPLFDAFGTMAADEQHDADIEQFLQSPAVVSRTDDDATLVLVLHGVKVLPTSSLPREPDAVELERSISLDKRPVPSPIGTSESATDSESKSDTDMTLEVQKAYGIPEVPATGSRLESDDSSSDATDCEEDDGIRHPKRHDATFVLPSERRNPVRLFARTPLGFRLPRSGGKS